VQSLTGFVFNIQRFSTHDGPGIRTTVFLKGCPFHCFWCHNPEGLNPRQEVQFFPDRCILCGECVILCEQGAHLIQDNTHTYDRTRCIQCGRCIEACCAEAVQFSGKVMSVDEVLEEVLRDEAFYETSKGGITLSGGEPLLQLDFTHQLLTLCKASGIHTAVETTLYRKWDEIVPLFPVVDLFLVDLKVMDGDQHRAFTGVSNRQILANARRLAGTDKPVIFHTPVIPTVNDTPEAIASIAEFVRDMIKLRAEVISPGSDACISLELLPFHRLAGGKYESLGLEYSAKNFAPVPQEKLAELLQAAQQYGIPVKIR
jgi:pyruvate formate lyase activating enzyme